MHRHHWSSGHKNVASILRRPLISFSGEPLFGLKRKSKTLVESPDRVVEGSDDLDLPESEVLKISRWLEWAKGTSSPFANHGAQGGVYICDGVTPPVIIKTTAHKGLRRLIDTFFLRREFRAYQKLRGLRGIPHCHGLLRGSFLVLERVVGEPRHTAIISDRVVFFRELFELIEEMHKRGVAHGDLQNRNNLLVVEGSHPCVIDFGAAEVRKGGFAPLSRALFRFLSRLDFNTWVKLKYGGRIDLISDEDRVFYRRTWIEKSARWVKTKWKHLHGKS